jgi:hypothetical protein
MLERVKVRRRFSPSIRLRSNQLDVTEQLSLPLGMHKSKKAPQTSVARGFLSSGPA